MKTILMFFLIFIALGAMFMLVVQFHNAVPTPDIVKENNSAYDAYNSTQAFQGTVFSSEGILLKIIAGLLIVFAAIFLFSRTKHTR
jgi:hypothetical protein